MKSGTANKNKSAKAKVSPKKKIASPKSTIKNVNFPNLEAPILITTSDFSTVKGNENFARLFDCEPQNITLSFFNSGKFFDINNKKLPIEGFPFAQAAALNHNVIEFQIKYIFDKERTGWFRVNSFLVDSTNTKIKTVVSIFSDITRDADVNNIFQETVSSINTVLYSTNSTGTEYNFITEAVRALFGFSGGGFFATYTLLTQPGMFRRYIAASCTWPEADEYLLNCEQQYAALAEHPLTDLYLAVGEFETDQFPGFLKLTQQLSERRDPCLRLATEIHAGEQHSAGVLVKTLLNGLRTVYKG